MRSKACEKDNLLSKLPEGREQCGFCASKTKRASPTVYKSWAQQTVKFAKLIRTLADFPCSRFVVRVDRLLQKNLRISAKTEKPDILSDIRLHNTGNNLLSQDSGVVLPSAAESLTSVFEMGTCVSSRLWSPESFCSRCLGSLSAAFQIFSMSRFLTQFNYYFQIAW